MTGAAGTLPAVRVVVDRHSTPWCRSPRRAPARWPSARWLNRTDPVRGPYLDNTDLARLLLHRLWATAGSG